MFLILEILSYKHLTWTFFHVEPRWNRVSNTLFVIILALKHPDSKTQELSFTPKHTNPKLETSTSHSTGDKCISSAVENSSMAENPFANPYSTGDKRISSAVETYWRQKTHWRTLKFSGIWSPHSTLSLSRTEVTVSHSALSLLPFIHYQTTSIHWKFCFSLIST